ncbi:MAG: FtsX-like permease family protein, partial [Acidobacteria bacterium]|nr:FtsX-like permease family protein [Acidobacteriota bacterium]
MRDLLRRWFRIPASSADIAEEFESHLAHKRRALEAEGLPPDEAERRARLALGNRSAWIEETRGAGGFPAIESVFRDLRYAARLLNKERVFSLIVVVSLALGIGANTAIFSLLNALLFRPLPVPAPEQLARLYFTNLPKGTRSWVNGREVQPTEMGHFNYAFYEALRRKPELTAGVFGHAGLGTMAMEHDGVPSQIVANFVTGTYLPVLGAAPLAGRLLNPEDDQPGQAAIVISERLWERVFQRRPGIVGAQVTVERVPFTIAGVMPRSFHGVQPGIGIEAWIPYAAMERMFPDFAWRSNRSIANLRLFVRTRPGAALEAHSRRVLEESVDPASNAEGREGYLAMRLHAQPIPTGLSSVTENYSGALWTLFGAVAAVLLISASNVTSLMAARAMRRARELAVRRALGASGWRIGRQLLLESLLLGAGGGALGFAVAQGIGDGVRAGLFGGERMFALDVSTDWRVALYISTMLVAVVLIAGLAPSWLAARTSIQTRGVTPAGLRLRSALIVGQTAIAFALLGGAALMAASVQALFQEPTGYDSARTLLLTPDLYNAGVERPAHRRAYENILRAVRASGRFESSGLLTTVPLIGALGMSSVEVPGKMDLPPRERMMIRQTVSDGYFSAMGIGLLAGSDFQPLGGPTAV